MLNVCCYALDTQHEMPHLLHYFTNKSFHIWADHPEVLATLLPCVRAILRHVRLNRNTHKLTHLAPEICPFLQSSSIYTPPCGAFKVPVPI